MESTVERRSDPDLRAAVDRLSSGVVVLDSDKRVIFANRRARALLGCALSGSTRGRALPARVLTALRGALSEDHGEQCVSLPQPPRNVQDRGGGPIAARVVGLGSGWVIELSPIERVQDGSEYVSTQTRLAVLARVATGIAHEVNNPLHPVLGYTELAKAYLEEVYDQVTRRGEALPWLAPERLKKVICYLAAVEESVQRIKTVMQRLLALGRPEPRGRSTIDLNRLVSESVEVVRGQFAGRQGKRVEMLVSLGEGLPSFTGKTKALQTALLALLLNAYDAIEDAGEIRVSTGRGEDEVFVVVEDDGCGIPEELMARIFEPFFTTKDPTTMPGASGLGLTEAARIVAQHEGSIKAWSAPGRGSRFTVSIPLSHAVVRQAPAPAAERSP